jgi:hypothetical protein
MAATLVAVVGLSAGGWVVTASAAPTTTTAPLTLSQWKDQYEPAVGQIADDALVVYDTGQKAAKHPSKKKVRAIVTACQNWHTDAEKLPSEVPPIPSAPAEKTWEQLIAASLSGSSDCTAALQHGSKSVTKDFQKQLTLVHADEGRLVSELGTSTQ